MRYMRYVRHESQRARPHRTASPSRARSRRDRARPHARERAKATRLCVERIWRMSACSVRHVVLVVAYVAYAAHVANVA
eukprot:5064893-Prymnesium_polylepis.2